MINFIGSWDVVAMIIQLFRWFLVRLILAQKLPLNKIKFTYK